MEDVRRRAVCGEVKARSTVKGRGGGVCGDGDGGDGVEQGGASQTVAASCAAYSCGGPLPCSLSLHPCLSTLFSGPLFCLFLINFVLIVSIRNLTLQRGGR